MENLLQNLYRNVAVREDMQVAVDEAFIKPEAV
jgi:hypothetical protein